MTTVFQKLVCALRGHTLGPFVPIPGTNAQGVSCDRCGSIMGIAVTHKPPKAECAKCTNGEAIQRSVEALKGLLHEHPRN